MPVEITNPESVLDGPHLLPVSGTPRHMVVFFHGYGSNGDDLINIGRAWQPLFPDALFFAPHGPEVCSGAPPGGRQWFDLRSFDPAYIAQGLRTVAPFVHKGINHELAKHNLTGADLALVGFSQGTILALHIGVSDASDPIACHPKTIVGYSGVFIDMASSHEAVQSTLPQILLIHGMKDMVVPSSSLVDSVSRLQAHGASCEWHLSPDLGHGIDEVGLQMGSAFLKKNWKNM